MESSVEPEGPEFDDPIRPEWTPDHVSNEETARTIYIPRNRRLPSVPDLGPEID